MWPGERPLVAASGALVQFQNRSPPQDVQSRACREGSPGTATEPRGCRSTPARPWPLLLCRLHHPALWGPSPILRFDIIPMAGQGGGAQWCLPPGAGTERAPKSGPNLCNVQKATESDVTFWRVGKSGGGYRGWKQVPPSMHQVLCPGSAFQLITFDFIIICL